MGKTKVINVYRSRKIGKFYTISATPLTNNKCKIELMKFIDSKTGFKKVKIGTFPNKQSDQAASAVYFGLKTVKHCDKQWRLNKGAQKGKSKSATKKKSVVFESTTGRGEYGYPENFRDGSKAIVAKDVPSNLGGETDLVIDGNSVSFMVYLKDKTIVYDVAYNWETDYSSAKEAKEFASLINFPVTKNQLSDLGFKKY